ALTVLSPTPRCWTCILEHRETSVDFGRSPHVTGSDHFIVVCQSHPKNGPYEEITFDYWEDRPAGESPEHFRSSYPQQMGGTVKGGLVDCGGNITRGTEFPHPERHR